MTDDASNPDTYDFVVDEHTAGQRLDKAIADNIDDLSRARVQGLITKGCVKLNHLMAENGSRKLKAGDRVEIKVPPPVDATPEPEDIPLDIVYEDEHLLVINKPVGLVAHPGAGNWSGTLVNALLHHCRDSLSGIGGVMRPGIVHRLDKETSGLMVVAKTDKAHQGLSEQLKDRSLSRVYKALVFGVPMPPRGIIDLPLARDPYNRLKIAVRRDGKQARTHYSIEKSWGDALSLVRCKLESGRTHQIRVHMQSIKHPLIGDPVYGPQPTAVRAALKNLGVSDECADFIKKIPHQALHAQEIGFIHPATQESMLFTSEYPDVMSMPLKLLD